MCGRVANRNIEVLKSLCPVGSHVQKSYCLGERKDEGKLSLAANIYDYKVEGSNGTFIAPAGVFVDYIEPKDAVH